jgi:hypothetical protein
MWTGRKLVISAHIDDFILACADYAALDTFRQVLLARFDETYEGAVHTYLGCEIESGITAGRTLLSQRHFAEDVPSRCGIEAWHSSNQRSE